MSFHLQREFVEALNDQQKVELFSNVCGYLEDSGDYLDNFNSAARWSKEIVLEYINTHFWKDFSAVAIADIKSGGDRTRLFQFVVLPQCRHLLPEAADQPHMEETGQVTRHTGHLVTCLVVPNFWSLTIPNEWKKEWFLSFYELEEEWIVGGYLGIGVDG